MFRHGGAFLQVETWLGPGARTLGCARVSSSQAQNSYSFLAMTAPVPLGRAQRSAKGPKSTVQVGEPTLSHQVAATPGHPLVGRTQRDTHASRAPPGRGATQPCPQFHAPNASSSFPQKLIRRTAQKRKKYAAVSFSVVCIRRAHAGSGYGLVTPVQLKIEPMHALRRVCCCACSRKGVFCDAPGSSCGRAASE